MINGIVLGSSLAISVSLSLVLVVFLVLGDEYPRLQHEFRPLLASLGVFFGMTVISAGSFYSLVVRHPARFLAQALMWLGLAGTTWYYWP